MNTGAFVVGALAYVSTNIDDFVLLTGLLADRPDERRTILIGHSVAMATLVAVSLSLAQVASALPRAVLSCLTLAPIILGFAKLSLGSREVRRPVVAAGPGGEAMIGVVGTLLAAGGDNLAVYVPTFALQPLRAFGPIFLSFGVLSVLWVFAAVVIASVMDPRRLGARMAKPLSPWLLIGLGGWALLSGLAS